MTALEALRAVGNGDLRGWVGLPDACTAADVEAAFGAVGRGRPRPGRVGDDARTLEWTRQPLEGDAVARIWWEGERPVLIETEYPNLRGGLDAALEELGEPAAELTYRFALETWEAGEWVWPEKGLTLFVVPRSRTVLRLAAYRPTDIESYRRELRLDFGYRPRPVAQPAGG